MLSICRASHDCPLLSEIEFGFHYDLDMLSKFDFSTLNLLLFRGDMDEYYKVIEKKHPKLKMDIDLEELDSKISCQHIYDFFLNQMRYLTIRHDQLDEQAFSYLLECIEVDQNLFYIEVRYFSHERLALLLSLLQSKPNIQRVVIIILPNSEEPSELIRAYKTSRPFTDLK
jgi:hypothetical protein